MNARWASYVRQASRVKTQPPSTTRHVLRTASLAAVVPIVAAGSAAAQCNSSFGGFTLTAPSGGTTYLRIPIAGASLGIQFYNNGTNLSVRASLSIGSIYQFNSYLVPLVYSDSVNAGSLPPGYSWGNFGLACQVSTGGTLGSFCNFPQAYMAYRVGANLGFVELDVISLSGNQAEVYVGPSFLNPVAGVPTHVEDCTSSLPVELTSFGGVFDRDRVQLEWETATELNNAGFEVERAGDGAGFRKVGYVAGSGTTNDAQQYRFADDSIEANVRYSYRLKQIDFDGTSSFSEVVEVFTEDPSQVVLSEFYPNPATNGRVNLEINVAEAIDATVEVFDVRGALVDSRSSVLNTGQNRLEFDTAGLAAGSHFAKVRVGERVMYRSFVAR